MTERHRYPSDLSDVRWELVGPVLTAWRARTCIGRPPNQDLRSLLDAVLYVSRTGIPWRYLPHDYPHWNAQGPHPPDLTPARARIHHLTCEIGDAKRTPEQQHSVGQELLAVMRHGEEGGSTDRATRLAEAIHIPAGSPRSTSSSAATAGQAPVVHEPSQGPLNGPAAGQNGKSPGGGVAADDVHVDAGGGGVLDEVLAVATVDPGLCSSSNQVSWLAQSSRWRNSTLASAPECA